MTSWTDKAGRRLTVLPAEGDNPARLAISYNESRVSESAEFRLDGNADLAEVAVAMFAANGRPAPVITPRPDIDPRRPYDFGPLRMRVNPRARGVDLEEGVSSWHWAPSVARQAAGCLVALADAAEDEPDPADVERLAEALRDVTPRDGRVMTPEQVAAALLRSGKVTLTGEDGDRG